MKTISEHIKHIHTKPHHVRRRIAFGAAGVGAGVLALVWLVGSVSSGVFALKPTSFADSAGAEPVTTVSGTNGASTNLAGAAAAPAVNDANAPARIEIVDVVATSSPQPQQTTIPF